jgi:hypothetical protein
MFILNICNNQSIKNIHAAAIINSEIAASNAYYAYMYSYNIIGDKFELGEEIISKSAHWSYIYALNVLNGRFELGEPAIAKSIFYYALVYTNTILCCDFYLDGKLICERAQHYKFIEE